MRAVLRAFRELTRATAKPAVLSRSRNLGFALGLSTDLSALPSKSRNKFPDFFRGFHRRIIHRAIPFQVSATIPGRFHRQFS